MQLGELRIISNDEVEWRVPDVDNPEIEDDACYYSSDFNIVVERCKLLIWPKWHGRNINVGLRRVSPGLPRTVKISVALKAANGQMEYETSWMVFGRGCLYSIKGLLSRKEYRRRKSELCTCGSITIVCRIAILIAGGFVFVGLTNVSSGPRPTQFSLALKAANGRKEYEISRMVFEKEYIDYCTSLLSREEYIRRKSELCTSGSITIVCRIAILTAEDLCKKYNDLSDDFNNLRKEYEDSQLKLEETKKEKADIKEELDACKTDKESISKEKLRLEDDLKAMRENLDGSRALVVPPKSKALQDLKQLFLNQENSDVVLRVKGREFMAHKAILTARSPVFASTFRTKMKEKETGIVDIEDCDPSSFSDFLSFLYCEELLDLSRENIFNLFTAADKYIITDLRTKCLDFMKGNLSVETFCETITVALQHTETELIRVCTDFFIENAEEIVETVKWQTFAAENSTESNELFIKYIKSVKRSHK